jgi:RNA polymerase sigma-70 factor (ECF subfamily)
MISIEGHTLTLSTAQSARSEIDLASLVEAYSGLLFRVAHSLLRSRSEAEDVVQDVFVRVLEHRSSLPEVRDMRVWLVRIAWNLAIDRRRRIRPDQMDDRFAAGLAANARAADQAFGDAQRISAVLNEIARLPRAERQVLLLSALEELETAEIAEVMRKTESAVRALLFRARTRLHNRLDQEGAL